MSHSLKTPRASIAALGCVLFLTVLLAAPAAADDHVAMLGGTPSRNMVSDETGLPATWNLRSGENVLWVQEVGSQSYAGPVVSGGKVFIGTNNEGLRNPEIKGDKGNLMAFDAKTGEFFWQIVHDKLPEGRIHDWPMQGVCSTPYVEGDHLYYVSNRAELIKATVDGEIVWSLDMIADLDVFPHNLAAGSPLVVGDLVYTVTGNGVDEGHINVPSPFAPSFIAVNKNTGELVWEDGAPGEKILHGSWSNPAYAEIAGRGQMIYPGGDGWVYSLDAKTGELIWKFDGNPKDSVWRLGGAGSRNNIIGTPVVYKDRVYIAVGQDPEHGEGPGHFYALDASKTGDITETGVVWTRGGEDFYRTISSVAAQDDIVYAADLSGFLYALNADTGELYWRYDAFAAVWGSPFVADGKVYLGDEDGDIVVLAHGKKLEELGEMNLGSAVYTTPMAHDGVLYILSRTQLFAFQQGASPKKADAEAEKKADASEG